MSEGWGSVSYLVVFLMDFRSHGPALGYPGGDQGALTFQPDACYQPYASIVLGRRRLPVGCES